MRTNALTVAAAVVAQLLLAAVAAGASATAAMPEQVPELMHRSILPVTSDVPTCAAVADRSLGESDYVVVGLANGTVNVLHPSGSDMIVRVIELDRSRPIDDVCAINLAATRSDFALFALQGSALSVMSSEISRVKETTLLPPPTGAYALARVPGASEGDGVRGDRAILYDERDVFEIRVGMAGQRWSLALEHILSDPDGLSVHGLSDRIVVVTSTNEIRELTASMGLLAPLGEVMDGSEAGAETARAIIPGAVTEDGSSIGVMLRARDGRWSSASVPLEDQLTIAVTVRDSMLLLGGAMSRDELRNTGWLALVDASGEIVAMGEHGRIVAAATAVGEWLAVQGERRNLSLYDLELTPVWDNSSQVGPLALLAAHLNADESEDLVVVGMRMFAVETERVDAIREVLDRPNFMDGAEERRGRMYLDRPMLNVYYSSAGELASIVEDRRRRADELHRSRDYVEAARHALTARAAAATLGQWETAETLRKQGADLLAMPRRERATLTAAVLLLVIGLWNAATAWRHASQWRSARAWWASDGWPLAALAVVALAVWMLLGPVFWSPALIAGAIVTATGVSIAWIRRDDRRGRRVAGAPIEELGLLMSEFTHGGDGSSRQGRKKLTTLAYLIQEMLDSIDDSERYELLRERLGLRFGSFYPAKYELAMQLQWHARDAGVAIDETETLAAAATTFVGRARVLVDTPDVNDASRKQELCAVGEDALEAWQTIRTSADAAAAIIQQDPGSSVTACIERVLDERREVLESMSVVVTQELGIDPSEDAVAIQRSHLHFIVENLVTNALRTMDDSTEKRLSFVGTARPQVYELRVTDTGCGIPEPRLREIFIPVESVLGGLGLPYSREILRRVSGNIEVEHTEVGVGTTMLVTLRYWMADTVKGE